MITTYFRTIKNKKLQTLDAPRTGCWVHVEEPTDNEIAALPGLLGVDEEIVRDALDPYEVPRLEAEDDMTYIFTRVPAQQGNETTVPFLIVLGPTYILTVAPQHFPFLDRFLTGDAGFYTTQKAKLFLQLFRAVTTVYNRNIAVVSKRVREMSAVIEEDFSNRHIAQFIAIEKTLNDFLSALVPTGALLRRLLGNAQHLHLHEQDQELVEDLLVDTQQLEEMSRSTLKYVVNIRTGYEAMLTNNLNRTMRFLAALTIIMTIPTVVGSFFGMNVPVPLAAAPHAFPLIVGGSFLGIVVAVLVFHNRRWM